MARASGSRRRWRRGGNGGFLDVEVPEGYAAPPLDWFRGLEMEATMAGSDLSAHVDVIMQLPPVAGGDPVAAR